MILLFRETCFLMISVIFLKPVLALIFDAFWNRFRFHLGSLLQLFYIFFRHRFLHRFLIDFLMENCRKMVQKIDHATPLFAPEIDPGAQSDSWMHYYRLLANFWRPLASLWIVFAPF